MYYYTISYHMILYNIQYIIYYMHHIIYAYLYMYKWVLKALGIIQNSSNLSKLPDSLKFYTLHTLCSPTFFFNFEQMSKIGEFGLPGVPFCLFTGLFFVILPSFSVKKQIFVPFRVPLCFGYVMVNKIALSTGVNFPG